MGINKENLEVEKMAGTKQCGETGSTEFNECVLVELMKRIELGETPPHIASSKSWEQEAPSQVSQNGIENQSRVPCVGQDNYVKLEAPSADDVEENEETLQCKDADSETLLEERGPMHGVPAPVSTQMDPYCNYIANKACKPYQIQNGFLMGAGDGMMSPEVVYTNPAGLNAVYTKGPKRGRDDRDMNQIPKYIKPQVVGPVENGSFTFPSCNANSSNPKAHCQVLQTQMSGGTMYTPQDPGKDTLDSGEIQELFNPVTIDPNFTFNIEDILLSSGPPPFNKTSSDLVNPALSTFDCQQWSSVSPGNPGLFTCYPPASSKLPGAQSQFLPAQQQFQPNSFSMKRNSLGADDGSDGYGSGGDLSPPHETQSSPVPSPYSVMESSPAGFTGSPPRVDWSPPPTNLSNSSMDSGFCSPRAEDMGGNTSTSPHHMPEMSPPHVSSNFVNPPQMKPGCAAPQSVVTSDWMSTYSALPQQNGSSQSRHKYQMSPMFQTDQDTENKDTENKWVSEHIWDLDIALQIAGEDLIKEQLIKQGKLLDQHKQRTCDISASMDNCSTLATVGMPASQTASQTIPVSSGLPPTTPRNLPSYEAATFPSTGATNRPTYVATSLQTTSVTNRPTYVATSLQTSSVTNLPTYIATNLQASSVTNLPTYIATDLQASSVTNLPTFVTSPRVVAVCQPFTSNRGGSPMVDPTKTVNSKGSPMVDPTRTVNSKGSPAPQGKVLIERINPKPRAAPCPTKKVPVIVTTCVGKTTPVLIVPPIFSEPRTTQRRLPDIAPKEPAKPVVSGDKTTNQTKASSGNNIHTNMSSCGQPDQVVKVQIPKGKKPHGNSMEKLLNLARRLVAEMATADLKYVDEDGDTYLHVAVCRADKFMVQALLERLVREDLREMIDKQNFEGQTPLYLAVSTNNAEMVQLLIEQGADVNPFAESSSPAGHTEKSTAIHCASSKGDKYLETLKALLKACDINLNLVNSYGHTALICAILAHGRQNTDKSIINSIPIIQALIHAGANLNLQAQHSGKTALMYALESRDLILIESVFHLVEPHMLASFLRTQAFDGSTCLRIAESIRQTLSPADQKRLCQCLKPSLVHSRGGFTS